MTTEEFITKCRDHVLTVAKYGLDVAVFPTDIQLVWYSKTLQNYKCIMCIPSCNDGRIYECTYDGDKERFYVDAYKKAANASFPLIDKSKPRYKRIGQKIVDLGENRDRIYPYAVTPIDPLKGESNDIEDLLDEFVIHIMSPKESAVLYTTREDFQKAFESCKDNPDAMISGLVVNYDRNECVVAAKMKNGEWELV